MADNDPNIKSKVTLSLVTQGDTSNASRVKAAFTQLGRKRTDRVACRVRVCDEGELDTATNATIAGVSGKSVESTEHTTDKDWTLYSGVGVSATGTLTLTGVVIEGETITLGTKSYKFGAGGLSSADLDGFTEIDISGTAGASEGTLTVDTQPTALDSMRIGSKTYTFVADGTANADGEISVGANLAGAQANIVAAINGTDDVNTAHPLVTAAAFATNASVITAKSGGTAGNSISTTESFTAGTNVFDATTLGTTTAGDDTTASEAVTAIAAALSGTATGVDGAGDTVVVTAAVEGTAGNIASTETMANASFGSATLTGGLDANPGEIEFDLTDATAETVTVRVGPADINAIAADYTDTLDVAHAD